MKKALMILLLPCLLMAGCGSKKLDKKIVFGLLQKQIPFPRTLDYDIYCSDPEYAHRLLNAGLEKDGLVNVQQKQKLIDVGNPLISFTEKAQPYLLPTPEKDRASEVQKVKLADEELTEILSIQENEANKTAVVEYTTAYKNISPFSTLVNIDFKVPKKHTIYLSLHDDQWHIQKKG